MSFDYRKLLELLDGAGSDGEAKSVAELISQSEFYQRHEDPIVRLGGGASDARPIPLARRVVACAHEKGAAYAAKALEALFRVEEVATVTYAYIENIVTETTIDLGANLVALPENRAPNAEFAEAIDNVRGKLSSRRGTILAARQIGSPFLKAASNDFGPGAFPDLGGIPGEDRIYTALKMITVCGPSSPAIRAMTTIVESDELRLFSAPEGINFRYPGYWVDGMPVPITEEVCSLIPQYSALKPDDQRRVDTSISRLRLAAARLDPSDAIVDLAIALEAILSDKGNKEDLTYRLRLRAALILESDLAGRQGLKALVNNIYKERSRVVHGQVPSIADIQLRKSGEQLVARLIRKILNLGGVPDWVVVELTGGKRVG